MLEFMDYVQHAFYNASRWNYENSYSNLTATARGTKSAPAAVTLADDVQPYSISRHLAASG